MPLAPAEAGKSIRNVVVNELRVLHGLKFNQIQKSTFFGRGSLLAFEAALFSNKEIDTDI